MPDFARLGPDDLVRLLESSSSRSRLEAQRVILRRPAFSTKIEPQLTAMAANRSKPLASRGLALFTFKLLRGADANETIGKLLGDPSICAWALRALGDSTDQTANLPINAIVAAFKGKATT